MNYNFILAFVIIGLFTASLGYGIREWQLKDYYEECYSYKEPIIEIRYNFTCYEPYSDIIRYQSTNATREEYLKQAKIGWCYSYFPGATYFIQITNRTCEKYHLVREVD